MSPQITALTLNKINSKYHWYAVYCRSRQEKLIERDLLEDGYEVYLPILKKLRVWSDRKKWVDMPLFPSYCFVRVSNKEYYKILEHPYVVKYISFEGKAVPIKEGQIDGIRRVLGENLDFELTTEKYKPGQRIEIGVGPMLGCCGEIIRVAGKKQLLIRLDNIGYSLVVKVPAAYIENRLTG